MDRDTLRREVKELLRAGSGSRSPRATSSRRAIFGEALGLDSIDALELVVLVEDRFHVSIPDEEVGGAPSLGERARRLHPRERPARRLSG